MKHGWIGIKNGQTGIFRIRRALVYQVPFPLIRPSDTFSLGEKATRRRGPEISCVHDCSNGLARSVQDPSFKSNSGWMTGGGSMGDAGSAAGLPDWFSGSGCGQRMRMGSGSSSIRYPITPSILAWRVGQGLSNPGIYDLRLMIWEAAQTDFSQACHLSNLCQ